MHNHTMDRHDRTSFNGKSFREKSRAFLLAFTPPRKGDGHRTYYS